MAAEDSQHAEHKIAYETGKAVAMKLKLSWPVKPN